MYLLFDIGGTKMRLATSVDGKKISAPVIVPTPQKFSEAMVLFKKLAYGLIRANKVKGVAGGVAGVFDEKKSKLIRSHLKDWLNKPLQKELAKIIGAPVYLKNDAELCGLGEAVAGAGKGHNIVAYITVSTGVGGARIVNAQIDQSVFGFEPGHQIIGPHQTNLEYYISGSGLTSRFHKEPKDIHDKKVWEETARWLALGLHNTIVHWSPEIVVLGGAMMKDIPIDLVRADLKKTLKIFPKLPIIKKAELGDMAGLVGAGAYISSGSCHGTHPV